MFSVVIPVYRTAEFIPLLVRELEQLALKTKWEHDEELEAVFVVDGSPDDSLAELAAVLPGARFKSQLIEHSRNFGSFAAIRTGLAAARGRYFAVIAADLQEPPSLLLEFLRHLRSGSADVAVGRRTAREDPVATQTSANLFWGLYRRLVMPQMTPGGVDVFGCNEAVRDELLRFTEVQTSLVGQLFWLGFRRVEVDYERQPRRLGKSGWTFRKKLTYLSDSIFAFTDLPVRLLLLAGLLGSVAATVVGLLTFSLRLAGVIDVPGYAPIVILIAFFGALNLFALGLVGSYAARTYENTKGRPLAVVRTAARFDHPSVARMPQLAVEAVA